MPEQAVTCPECGHKFPLTEVLKGQIEEQVRSELQEKLARKEKTLLAELAKKEKELERRERAAKELEESVEETVSDRVKERVEKLKVKVRAEAEEELAVEIGERDQKIEKVQAKLREAQQREADLRTEKQDLEDQKRELNLKVQRTLEEERTKIRERVVDELAEENKLKETEHQEKLRQAQETIEDLKRKLSQGSQQAQGEAMEILLERDLAASFSQDQLDPVPKGKTGADVLQRVKGTSGRVAGTIIWEAKRTKNWSDGWIAKVKEDQRRATAEVAVLVTQVLPEGVKSFDLVDGVVVTDFASALPLAAILRERLIEVDRARRAETGRVSKESLVYQYLTSTEFRQTAQAVAEALVHARMDIQKERATFERMWAKREAQLEKGFKNLVAMWGKMQGHIGSLPDLHQLASLEAAGAPAALPPGEDGDHREGGPS